MDKQFVVPEHKDDRHIPFSKEHFRTVHRNIKDEQQVLGKGFVLDSQLSDDLISNIGSKELSEDFKSSSMITISKEFSFAAAHALPHHKGKCRFLHGHEWRLKVSITGPVDAKEGMVMDFSDLKKIVNSCVIDKLDHSYVNGLLFNPTAENMVVYIWNCLQYEGNLKGISKIVLWETPTSHAILVASSMSKMVTGMWGDRTYNENS